MKCVQSDSNLSHFKAQEASLKLNKIVFEESELLRASGNFLPDFLRGGVGDFSTCSQKRPLL